MKTIIITIIITMLVTMGFLYVLDTTATDFTFVEAYNLGILPNCGSNLCIAYDRNRNVVCYYTGYSTYPSLSCMRIEK